MPGLHGGQGFLYQALPAGAEQGFVAVGDHDGSGQSGAPLAAHQVGPELLQAGNQVCLDGGYPAVFQALGGADAGGGITLYTRTDNANGYHEIACNCYKTAGGYTPISGTSPCWRILLGAGYGLRMLVADPLGSTAELAAGAWVNVGGWLVPNANNFRTQCGFVVPQMATLPTYSSGDVWKGCLVFRTGDAKLCLNTGGSTWVVLNP